MSPHPPIPESLWASFSGGGRVVLAATLARARVMRASWEASPSRRPWRPECDPPSTTEPRVRLRAEPLLRAQHALDGAGEVPHVGRSKGALPADQVHGRAAEFAAHRTLMEAGPTYVRGHAPDQADAEA